MPRSRGRSPPPSPIALDAKKSGGALANRQTPRPFLFLATASAFPSGLTLDALMFGAVAASVVAVVAAARAFAAFVVFAACAFVRVADFSLRWRSAWCTADVPVLAVAGVFAAADPACWPDPPAAFDTSDLSFDSRYSELPDVDTQADLSDAQDYLRAPSQLGSFPYRAPLRAR